MGGKWRAWRGSDGTGAVRTGATAALTLLLGLSSGCASSLEQAREAEVAGDLARATELYRTSMDDGDAEEAASAKRALFDLSLREGKARLESDPGSAAAFYRTALDIDPDAANARLGLSRALLRLGRPDEAEALLADDGSCARCGEFRRLLMLDRAAIALEAGELDEARETYGQALRMSGGEDALAALGIAEVWSRGTNQSAALESLRAAAGLIEDDEPEASKRFAVIRSRIAVEAAKAGNIGLADRALEVSARGVGRDAYYATQLDVARAELAQGELDDPIARLARFVPDVLDPRSGASNSHGDMAPSRRAEVVSLLVDLYSSRAAHRLRERQVGPAENDLTYALRLDPDNATVKLQRVLVISGFGKLDLAFHKLGQIEASTPGHDEVEAILLAMRVEAHLQREEVDVATEVMKDAQGRGDLPEVHLAFAKLLTFTPMGLDEDATARLRSHGVVRYPDGPIPRYGEALAEIAWARRQIDSYGIRFPYRGPGTEERLTQLHDHIRTVYPLEVSFHDGEAGTVTLRHERSRPLSVHLRGPGGLDETLEVPSGAEGATRVVPGEGVVEIEAGGRTLAVVSEPYTAIVVPL